MNIYISYFTLRASSRLLHTRVQFGRLAGASVFGGFSALAALADTGALASLLLKAALTAAAVLIAYGFGNFGLFALRSFVCIAVSMLICGAAVLIHELTGSDLIFSANGYVYMSVSALVLVVSSAVIYGVLLLVRRILDKPESGGLVKLRVTNLGRTAELSGLPDSGNGLRDFLTGRPVIVCRRSSVAAVTPRNVSAYLAGCTDDLAGIRLIPMNTAAGSGIAAAFRPDSVTVGTHGNEKPLDALIAVSEGALDNESFEALIPTGLLK